MTLDDFKSKTMKKNQSDQVSHEEKAKGLHFHSPWRWYTVIVTLGIMCMGLLVTIIVQVIQLSQVSDLLKQQQANLTRQENLLEGQFLAQKEVEKSSQESQRELKAIIEALSKKLDEESKEKMELKAIIEALSKKSDEESKEKMELHSQNLNLQEALKKAANYSGPCPQDWIWHGKSCYFFTSDSFNWEKSQENCLSLGAQMLKIVNTEDLDFIQKASAHSSFPLWIGLSRRKSSTSWSWEDGSSLMHSLFRIRGAMSQNNLSDSCVYVQRGTFFADNCILNAFSICQKSATLQKAE